MISVIFADPTTLGFVAIIGSVVVVGVSYFGIRFTLKIFKHKSDE